MLASPQDTKLPPMLQQYLECKSKYPDALLFFQVGDFYELFFEDAVTVSKSLNLTLTSRDKNQPNPVPMCGVPIAVVDGYISRLVALGFSAALVSQVGTPEPGKGMVERRLERIITPGIRVMGAGEGAEDAAAAALIVDGAGKAALAFSRVESGIIYIGEDIGLGDLRNELSRVSPSELVVPHTIAGRKIDKRQSWLRDAEVALPKVNIKFRGEPPSGEVLGQRSLSSVPGFSSLGALGKKAARLLVQYIDETISGSELKISEVRRDESLESMSIDAATRRTLELTANARDGSVDGSLLSVIDSTITPAGGRLLRQWIVAPLRRIEAIAKRQEAVASFHDNSELRASLRSALRGIAGLERLASRLELRLAGPSEMGALRDGLSSVGLIGEALTRLAPMPTLVDELRGDLKVDKALYQRLSAELSDNPPHMVSDGGVFRSGVSGELDKVIEIKRSGSAWIAQLESQEREKSGIGSLKIKFNGVLGYFFEVTAANKEKVPSHFIRRQSTANTERFTTEELKVRESEVLGAESKQIQLEKTLFNDLREFAAKFAPELKKAGESLAALDALSALAETAVREDFSRPTVHEGSSLEIHEGRHPVVAKLLRGGFIPNSLEMPSELGRCHIITGPNMGGKSTYLRQAGIICVLAQIGSFVPAKSASVGIVDKVFARIGASDDLSEGDSTFMVEMREASHIINNATSSSLVLIDEIGRGTATLDGLALARAILEHLASESRARTLFATHFYELTGLESGSANIRNFSVGVVERDGEVVFTHEIRAGAASRSYGLEVARRAGLPYSLLDRAQALLDEISSQASSKNAEHVAQLPMFAAVPKRKVEEPGDYQRLRSLAARVKEIELNETTPLQAIQFLDELKSSLPK